ncbi:hypothetical protein GCM10011607_11730 [Shewanella inventionis]|uniref:Uncharacterized protein n=1 Tax=Shewanella inventionis TaxID=1738770 RepID=A0ABQ1IUM6_9GAMM|nr:hypothetical protein [Shewanella inventionis]GGB52884.1 hypothetical protein GCM10011607_11730 [Shewanella inventionis]
MKTLFKTFTYKDWLIILYSESKESASYTMELKHSSNLDTKLESKEISKEHWLTLQTVEKNKQLFGMFDINFKVYPQIKSVINAKTKLDGDIHLSLVSQKISGEHQIVISDQVGEIRLVVDYTVLTVESFDTQLRKYFGIILNLDVDVMNKLESFKKDDFDVHVLNLSKAEQVLVDIVREGEYDFHKQAFSKYAGGGIDKNTYIEAIVNFA